MHDWSFGLGMGSMSLMWLFWLLLVGLAAWALAAVLGRRPPTATDMPEQILKRRYATGDITREEFERALDDLRR